MADVRAAMAALGGARRAPRAAREGLPGGAEREARGRGGVIAKVTRGERTGRGGALFVLGRAAQRARGPPRRGGGRRRSASVTGCARPAAELKELEAAMEAPCVLFGTEVAGGACWHLALSTKGGVDRDLTDAEWAEVAREAMRRLGFDAGDGQRAVPLGGGASRPLRGRQRPRPPRREPGARGREGRLHPQRLQAPLSPLRRHGAPLRAQCRRGAGQESGDARAHPGRDGKGTPHRTGRNRTGRAGPGGARRRPPSPPAKPSSCGSSGTPGWRPGPVTTASAGIAWSATRWPKSPPTEGWRSSSVGGSWPGTSRSRPYGTAGATARPRARRPPPSGLVGAPATGVHEAPRASRHLTYRWAEASGAGARRRFGKSTGCPAQRSPGRWREATEGLGEVVRELGAVPAEDVTTWRAVASDAAGVLAVLSGRLERFPGPLAHASGLLARSAQGPRQSQRRPATSRAAPSSRWPPSWPKRTSTRTRRSPGGFSWPRCSGWPRRSTTPTWRARNPSRLAASPTRHGRPWRRRGRASARWKCSGPSSSRWSSLPKRKPGADRRRLRGVSAAGWAKVRCGQSSSLGRQRGGHRRNGPRKWGDERGKSVLGGV